MLDPRTGEVLVLASTPVYDASAIANPATEDAGFDARSRRPGPAAPDPGDAGAVRAGLGVQDRDRDRRPRLRCDHARHDVPGAGRGREDGPGRQRLPDPTSTRRPGTDVRLREATEVSSNIWFALAGLETGGENLVDYAGRLGFGAPLPFDLPTAVSQVTERRGVARRAASRTTSSSRTPPTARARPS